MDRSQLIRTIQRKRSLLCVGLDTEVEWLPDEFQKETDPVLAFNKAIIDHTHDLTVAYKINVAFYEAMGSAGWLTLERTVTYLRTFPDLFLIADAKRGDIGNTARKYAEAFFERLDFDAVTVAPYMGSDSVTPFLGRPGKWAIVLGVTSNQGALDLQFLPVGNGERLFQRVMRRMGELGSEADIMFVVGATKRDVLSIARATAPNHFLLVPGVGAQGGDLHAVLEETMTREGGVLVNSSRGILRAGEGTRALTAARRAAEELHSTMAAALVRKGVVGDLG
jgi:orotidine-5'-phosphate decarboxylase